MSSLKNLKVIYDVKSVTGIARPDCANSTRVSCYLSSASIIDDITLQALALCFLSSLFNLAQAMGRVCLLSKVHWWPLSKEHWVLLEEVFVHAKHGMPCLSTNLSLCHPQVKPYYDMQFKALIPSSTWCKSRIDLLITAFCFTFILSLAFLRLCIINLIARGLRIVIISVRLSFDFLSRHCLYLCMFLLLFTFHFKINNYCKE